MSRITNPNLITTRNALELARSCLEALGHHLEADHVQAILDQRGDFEPGKDTLCESIDTWIFG